MGQSGVCRGGHVTPSQKMGCTLSGSESSPCSGVKGTEGTNDESPCPNSVPTHLPCSHWFPAVPAMWPSVPRDAQGGDQVPRPTASCTRGLRLWG